jgi:hypothetical protein
VPLVSTHAPHPTDFATDGEEPPRAGYRARLWRRFDQAWTDWLQTPEGRFACFCAQRDEAPAGVTADRA